jgi:peptidoglycan/xylan/chitin deacetylase (PgdA/CDA1 family)
MTHPSLTTLSLHAAREEISASKKAIEDRFGRKIGDFAYPFGDWNEAVRELVGEAGFERAWTITPDVITRDVDLLALPRFPASISLRNPLNLLRSLPPPGRALWHLFLESTRLRKPQKT